MLARRERNFGLGADQAVHGHVFRADGIFDKIWPVGRQSLAQLDSLPRREPGVRIKSDFAVLPDCLSNRGNALHRFFDHFRGIENRK